MRMNLNINKKKVNIIILAVLVISVQVCAAADLQKPSPVRGWAALPTDAQAWMQTLIDWSYVAVLLVAVAAVAFFYVRGRIADTGGSIQEKSDANAKIVSAVVGGIILLVAIAFIWKIFWT
jgi:hypothetical protein